MLSLDGLASVCFWVSVAKMTNNWAVSTLTGSSELFETFHAGLEVRLIATPREELKTCHPDELILTVVRQNTEPYDFIPVIDDNKTDNPVIIGLFHAGNHTYPDETTIEGRIGDIYRPLSEEFIIGGDSSILEFIKDADARPCRLIVSGANISGLVSLSDLQKLPVRAVLFALITGLEITMMDAIRRMYKDEKDWLEVLSPGRRKIIEDQKRKSRAVDVFVDTLLFTQFSDKKILIKKRFTNGRSKSSLENTLSEIELLRDNVAHANDYAKTPAQARGVCKTVRDLLKIRLEISKLL